MKKRGICILMLVLLYTMGLVFIPNNSKTPHLITENGQIALLIETDKEEIRIQPWLDAESGIYYFFLPSCISTNQVMTGMLSEPMLNWKENEVYEIEIFHEGQEITYPVSIMKSSMISSVHIATVSGSTDALHADKGYEESGNIFVVTAKGEVEFSGGLERISGRGNTSWEYTKKPYSIKLKESQQLCGLQKGKKWNLLPLWREGNKMNTRVLFDIAAAAGLQYTPESTWIDLYINEEYMGIYMLCESISVSGGRVEIADLEDENEMLNPELEEAEHFIDEYAKGYELSENPTNITGGYLIEKDIEEYYTEEDAGFVTDAGAYFSISAPQHASREQVYYIKDYVQIIEDTLASGGEGIEKYIDIESFAAKYIVDEISLNYDTNTTSMYYYKEKNDDLLYAGPVWDYDSALGECNAGYAEGWYVNYHNSVMRDEGFDWYSDLYECESFTDSVERQYRRLLPYLRELIEHTIEQYAETIEDSVAMDSVRWKNEEQDKAGNYLNFDSNVRYLKYFLSARLNWFSDRLGVSDYNFRWSGNSDTHEVTFIVDRDIVEQILVEDGETIEELPLLDTEKYWGWFFEYNNERYREQLPILEDVTLYPREK